MLHHTPFYSHVHPQFREALPDWMLCGDCFAGERRIKKRAERYLPRTEGQLADPQFGKARYEAYKERAVFYHYFARTAADMLGILHGEAPEALELPERIAGMKERFTAAGDSLQSALRLVNIHQLIFGRCGLLLDMPQEDPSPDAVPAAAFYPAARILDWESDSSGRLCRILLDDSDTRFDPVRKIHEFHSRLRVCALDSEGIYYTRTMTPEEYESFDLSSPQAEIYRPAAAGRVLDRIPFFFINACTNAPEPGKPPLLPLAVLSLAIYRGEADYRHALFMQGQSTLFLKGFPLDDPPMTGAGNYIHTESPDGDGKFLEISGKGLSEMRLALNDLHERAGAEGIHLSDLNGESGAALKTRLAVRTALLRNIASAAGDAFQNLLRTAAEWCGCDPEEAVFRPNMDFTESAVSADEAEKLLAAKTAGLPLSGRSLHEWLRKNDFTDISYDQELREIRSEGKIN